MKKIIFGFLTLFTINSIQAQNHLEVGDGIGNGYFYVIGSTNTNPNSKLRLVKWSTGNGHLDVWDGKNLHFNYYKGGHIYFGNGQGAAHSVFTNTGKLAINKVSPESGFNLDVNGKSIMDYLTLRSTSDSEGGELKLKGAAGYNDWKIDNFKGNFRLFHSGGEYFKMKPNGYLGLGTSNPQAVLDIVTTKTLAGKYQNQNAALRITQGATELLVDPNEIYTNNALYLAAADNHDIRFRNVYPDDPTKTGTDLVAIKSSGKVGIGTNAPNAKLEVIHSTTMAGRFMPEKAAIKIGNSSGSLLIDENEIYSDLALHIGTSNSKDIKLRTIKSDNTIREIMTLKASGNVGIGVKNATEKLHVNGKIIAEEILVQDVSGADFVFEEDYDLRSLSDTEAFIKEHKHLPEIPSAANMAENGLGLKEMNILLLQKVEELTLHLIQQEKEKSKLHTSMDALKTRIEALEEGQ